MPAWKDRRFFGRNAEGLEAIQEAVTVYRRLALDNPDRFEPDLATSLPNLSTELARSGRNTEALQASQEAMTLQRRLARDNPLAAARDVLKSRVDVAKAVETVIDKNLQTQKIRLEPVSLIGPHARDAVDPGCRSRSGHRPPR